MMLSLSGEHFGQGAMATNKQNDTVTATFMVMAVRLLTFLGGERKRGS